MSNLVSFDEFNKLDIRIGTIISAEKVDGADKLIKLLVDIGTEKRQIAAGIAEFYNATDLIGKQVPILINLEPKTFRGIESQGMMLAADDNGKPILLHPSEEIPPGSIIK